MTLYLITNLQKKKLIKRQTPYVGAAAQSICTMYVDIMFVSYTYYCFVITGPNMDRVIYIWQN